MSASDNLSTKCSGLLLRSSFAILVARARHLFSAVPMPAFSVASRPSNSSDIMRSLIEHFHPRLIEGSVASLRLRYGHALNRASAVSSLPVLRGFDDLHLRVLIEIEDHLFPVRQLDHKLQ